MKRWIACAALLMSSNFTFAASPPTSQPAAKPDFAQAVKEYKQLLQDQSERYSSLDSRYQMALQRCVSLEEENNKLKQDLIALHLQAAVPYKSSPYSLPGLSLQPSPLGKPFEFNGRIIYVEPIKTAGTVIPSQPSKPADLIDNRPGTK